MKKTPPPPQKTRLSRSRGSAALPDRLARAGEIGVSIDRLGELYEIDLSRRNKIDKKVRGQYFTPGDVAELMSDWFLPLKGENLCDVCCGTGNLIVPVLRKLGRRKARALIAAGRLYLYDLDETALTICRDLIGALFGRDIQDAVRAVPGDFLSSDVRLPENCKVISNPPYSKIRELSGAWTLTDALVSSREYYSAIMEKILDQSRASVIITPYSFIGGKKFYPLRRAMNGRSGFIVSFDNVPGNIFRGKKHGVFNSNTSNSVRAAITVTDDREKAAGYRVSPLIRFKNEERAELLTPARLESFLGKTRQSVTPDAPRFRKCFPALEEILDRWRQKAEGETLSDLLAKGGKYALCVPSTCRYFSVASRRDLRRVGKYTLAFDDAQAWGFAYAMINSSFCYWHWRLYDGGIAYPISLLKEMPSVYHRLTPAEKRTFFKTADEMARSEEKFLSYKKNAGRPQENIKFPTEYRERINRLVLRVLGFPGHGPDPFGVVHSNRALSASEGE